MEANVHVFFNIRVSDNVNRKSGKNTLQSAVFSPLLFL